MSQTQRMLRTLGLAVLVLSPAVLVAQEAASPAAEEEQLIQTLQSDKPIFDKAKACQRLAVIGTKKSVPVLAELLSDEELAHYARFGLEPIPDPSVDAALRAAMGKLEGQLLVGVINSIGVRGDTEAQAALTKLLEASDLEVAAAAAAALGRIGNLEAAGTLEEALATQKADLRRAVADACLFCAEALLGADQRRRAIALYDTVRLAEIPQHYQLAALRGAILARRGRGTELLIENLEGEDPAAMNLALGVARELRGRRVTRELVGALEDLPAERKALLIGALGDRGEPAALEAVLAAAKAEDAEVRLAALEALGKIGDASAVPVLLSAAAAGDEESASIALESLETLQGKQIDKAIAAQLESAEGNLRPILITMAGRRQIASAVPALRKAAEDSNPQVRLAAIGALGRTITLADIPVLTGKLAEAGKPEEKEAVQRALKGACRRMPDRDACVAKLEASMNNAPVEAQGLILGAFSSVGGEKALEAVVAYAGDSSEEIREAAIRTLGEWETEDAAHALVALARDAASDADRTRALRAFNGLVRRLGFPKEERIGVSREAMEIARSQEQKDLVLHTLAGIPAPETLDLLASYMEEPDLREGACAASVTIGERLVRSKPAAVQKAMKKVLETTEKEGTAEKARRLYGQAGGK